MDIVLLPSARANILVGRLQFGICCTKQLQIDAVESRSTGAKKTAKLHKAEKRQRALRGRMASSKGNNYAVNAINGDGNEHPILHFDDARNEAINEANQTSFRHMPILD